MSSSTLILLFFGFIPSFVWLLFFLQEDSRHPEPKGLILSTFLWGGMITFYVFPLQLFAKNLLDMFSLDEFSFITLTTLAGIEEIMKFAIVYIWISRRKDFDEPIDAMIYMIIAALGFATVENIATALKAPNSFELLTLRFIGANLLHSLASGFVGYFWAKGIYSGNLRNLLIAGLFWAILIHGTFNYLMIIWGPGIRVASFLIFMAFLLLNDFEVLKKPKVQLAP